MQVPLVTAHLVPGRQSMSEVQARFRQTLKKTKSIKMGGGGAAGGRTPNDTSSKIWLNSLSRKSNDNV